ncbi:polynucleotide 3'-phosphatase ZDP isoform X2 [Ananas comosus]|uniref:Polynucleotide 3'-phosphatase ZDP isoform X2 n=1 Tax=Ananas comosus TaxID=4615 RepID=A0A6P5FS91_ANACO|nr:polynucleotide 3'-phosphatase ZDP isoform X2 [Ananas comosus]
MPILSPYLSLISRNPSFPNLFFLSASARLAPLSPRPPMAPPKFSVEYAKSGRSSCKSCGKAIAAGAVRLGSPDPRWIDALKWYHLDCFPTKSHAFATVEAITGFSSLKKSDQEALRKLEAGAIADETSKVRKRDSIVADESEELSPSKGKVHRVDRAESKDLKGKGTEEAKISGDPKRNGLGLVFSASEIKDKYKEAILSPNWKAFKTVIFREREEGLLDSAKIAAFDFDGCLANTSVKRHGADAWSLLYPSIPEKLQGLYESGFKLVIFTNESNIERWKNKRQQAVDSKIGRLDSFIKCVNVPMQVFIACGLGESKYQACDPFRKPKPGMWRLMEEHFNSGIGIDLEQSFYVGDAAGRANDHSDADIKFAEVIGLKFHVPEDFFSA